MAKIIKIIDQLVIVGLDDGSAFDTSKSNFHFQVKESMEIQVSKHGNGYVFSSPLTPAPRGKVYVQKLPYVLLRLFLGPLGVHHFYAGNIISALSTLLVTIISIAFYFFGNALLYTNDTIQSGQSLLVMASVLWWGLNVYLILTAIGLAFKIPNSQGEILIRS